MVTKSEKPLVNLLIRVPKTLKNRVDRAQYREQARRGEKLSKDQFVAEVLDTALKNFEE